MMIIFYHTNSIVNDPLSILQFALHYSWSTEARARQALANVSALLRPGGTFIGTMPDANVIIKRLRECMLL
jgi:mRNA (guanine-N7-)-methyltransferase